MLSAAAIGVVNGDFADADGWVTTGAASIANGVATLREDARYLSSLRQTLSVPAAANRLSFVIRSATLGRTAGTAPDAFEVALLNGAGTASLLAPITGFGQTDALLNMQADGSVRRSAGVVVTGTPSDPAGMAVVVDLSGLSFADGALLSFDLIGMGALDGVVVIDDVMLSTGQNAPPVAVDDSVQTTQGQAILIDPTANDSDPDGNPLTVTIIDGPDHGTLTPPAAGATGWLYTPAPGYTGADAFTYQIGDGRGGFNTAVVSITVAQGNAAPVLAPVANRTATAGTQVSFQLAATDADHPASSLVYSLVTGPAGAQVSAGGVFSWTAAGANSVQPVRVRVTDPAGATSEQTFTISVTPAVVNAAPVLAPVASRTATAGTPVTFQLSATDADHPASSLVYSLVTGPAGAQVSAAGVFSWTATGANSVQPFQVRVTDPAGATSEQSFTISVTPAVANAAPVLAPVESRTATAGTQVSFQLAATDADHPASSLVYSLVSGPAGAAVTNDGQFSWTAAGANSVEAFRVRVTDPAGAISDQTFTISVTPVVENAAPVLAPVANRNATAGTQVTFQLAATDADHPASSLVYSLVSGPAGAAVTQDGQFSWTAAGANTVQAFRVRVTDPAGAISEQTFAIGVLADQPTNGAPVLAPIATRRAVEGSVVTVTLSATDAETPADQLVYSLVSGPAGAVVTPNGVFSWTAAGADTSVPCGSASPTVADCPRTECSRSSSTAPPSMPRRCWRRSRAGPPRRGRRSRSSSSRPMPTTRRAAWSIRWCLGRPGRSSPPTASSAGGRPVRTACRRSACG
jgi:hypothetical protein